MHNERHTPQPPRLCPESQSPSKNTLLGSLFHGRHSHSGLEDEVVKFQTHLSNLIYFLDRSTFIFVVDLIVEILCFADARLER